MTLGKKITGNGLLAVSEEGAFCSRRGGGVSPSPLVCTTFGHNKPLRRGGNHHQQSNNARTVGVPIQPKHGVSNSISTWRSAPGEDKDYPCARKAYKRQRRPGEKRRGGGRKENREAKKNRGNRGFFPEIRANRKKTGNKERGNNIENRGRRRTRRGKGENRETDDEQTTKENKNKEKSRGGVRWTSNLKLSNTIIFTFKLQLQVRPSSSCPVSAFSKLLNGGKVIVQCTRDN